MGVGSKVLIVEDEPLLLLLLEEEFRSRGFDPIGACTVSEALDLVDSNDFQSALLDINVAGEMVYPVAEALAEQDVHCIFVSGYVPVSIAPDFVNLPYFAKPLDVMKIVDAMNSCIARKKNTAGGSH